jgi:glyoxylase-like metal-dependent hydrolase (beta-lactamase superfamily II)/rhodanese-related sulfurtransferase
MDVELVVTKGLGDNSYLVASGDEAAVIDPQRDAGRFLAAADTHGWTIRHVLETHVHNDYVSGALEIRSATRAEVAGPADAGYRFPFRPMREGDEIAFGNLRLVAMETPGHTPEHTAYLAYAGEEQAPAAAFTGGSLMVGGAGRTDLLGMDRADELTRAQYRTLHRLAALPGDVEVFPTHGAGSFCGAGPAPRERTSTVRHELRRNRALTAPDEESFVRQQLSGLLAYPDYYREMAPINRAGPRVLGGVRLPPALSAAQAADRMERGAWLIDARSRSAFAEAHVPGSLNVELDPAFASYVGWIVPFDAPLVLILPDPFQEALREVVTQLVRIGYEHVEGHLVGGMDAWVADGREVRSYPTAEPNDLCEAFAAGVRPQVLDVRQRVEWDRGHIPGSTHLFVGELPDRLHEITENGEVWVICASGQRSSIAGSILDRVGVPVRVVTRGGVDDWLASCGDRG